MTKSENNSNPLQLAYQSMDESAKILLRDKILTRAGISLPQFYVIIRNGRAKKLQRQVFAKAFGMAENDLFPENLV